MNLYETFAIKANNRSKENEIKINYIGQPPRDIYANLIDLQTYYPNGTDGVFEILEDNKWYYWNGSAWISGGNIINIDGGTF